MSKKYLKLVLLLNFIIFIFYIILYNNITNFSSTPDVKSTAISLENLVFNFEANPISIFSLKILILCESTKSILIKNLINRLESLRLNFKIATVYSFKLKKKINLASGNRTHFSLIVFESIDVYNSLGSSNEKKLLEFCEFFQVGIIFLLGFQNTLKKRYIVDQIELRTGSVNTEFINTCTLNYADQSQANSFFKLTKFTKENLLIPNKSLNQNIVHLFETEQYETIVRCEKYNIMLKTAGTSKQTRKIFIGFNIISLPILTSLLIDSISYASHDRFNFTTTRYIQIDIDDIFVAATGTRMKSNDVDALIRFQDSINRKFFNQSKEKFKFNLGFSGYYFQSGSHEENLGDSSLIGKFLII